MAWRAVEATDVVLLRVMLSRRLRAPAFVSGALLAIAAGVGCAQAYAEGTAPAASADSGSADAPDPQVDGAEADTSPTPVPPPTSFEVASGLSSFGGIAATDTMVYVTETSPARVSAFPIGGGARLPLLDGVGRPGPITLAASEAIWSDLDVASLTRGSAGGSIQNPFNAPAGRPGLVLSFQQGFVVSLSVDPASQTGEVHQYEASGDPKVSTPTSVNPGDLVAASSSKIYWTEPNAGQIRRGFVGVDMNVLLVDGEPGCAFIAEHAGTVYWTRPSAGLVRALGAGTTGAVTLASGETGLASITADDSGVYWLTSDGRLRRKRIDQELPPATIAQGFAASYVDARTHRIALTAKYIVWLTSDGRILRADK